MDMEFLQELGLSEETANAVLEKHSQELDGIQLDFSLERELTKRGVKSMEAAMKLFDKEGLSFSDGRVLGLSEKLDSFEKENDFLFSKGDTKPVFSKPTAGSADITKAEFEKMGYGNRLKLYNENPELYHSLAKGI